MRVKTCKANNGKWYVEVVDPGNSSTSKGEQLDASDSISLANFVSPRSSCGFKSRRMARLYLTAYMGDLPNYEITGGLH